MPNDKTYYIYSTWSNTFFIRLLSYNHTVYITQDLNLVNVDFYNISSDQYYVKIFKDIVNKDATDKEWSQKEIDRLLHLAKSKDLDSQRIARSCARQMSIQKYADTIIKIWYNSDSNSKKYVNHHKGSRLGLCEEYLNGNH